MQPVSLDGVVHIIQTALTPVFLLSGVAALLNVFATRLGRVADRIDQLTAEARACDAERKASMETDIEALRRRSHVLDWAVVLGAVSATATCAAILMLFLASLLKAGAAAWLLIGLFGAAIITTVGAVAAYGAEMLMASRGLRAHAHINWPGARRPKR
jgi:hypothetical protein